jgi:hypothetical protein
MKSTSGSDLCASASWRLGVKIRALGAADEPKGVDWSWLGRIMPAKSGGREGTRLSGFGFSRQKTSKDDVSLSE